MMRAFTVIMAIGLISLAGCAGDDDGSSPMDPPSPATAEGRFLDTVVQGLSYSSGAQMGLTDADGKFRYEVNSDVTFSVGMAEVGTVQSAAIAGDGIVTPIDLTGTSSSNTETLNITRFLLMLDVDSDSSNGITISDDVRTVAQSWSQPDFTTNMLDTELASIIADVSAADSRTAVLPTADQARTHLEATIACLSSGIFAGTFSGTDNGSFLLWIQHERFDPIAFGDDTPRVGVTSALVYSADDDIVLGVAPQEGLSFDRDRQFLSGVVANGASFSGELRNYSALTSGTWENGLTADSGTFTGERKGGSAEALYRLSGFFNLQAAPFTPDGTGVVALDIFADNTVTGVLVTLRGDETTLTGTLSGSDLSVSGGTVSLTLQFDADGTDSSNDASLGTTSGFIGTMMGPSGTSDVIGTSCTPD